MKRLTTSWALLASLFAVLIGTVNAQPAGLKLQAPSQAVPVWGRPTTARDVAGKKIAPEVQAALASLQEEEMVTAIVTLKDQEDLRGINHPNRGLRLASVVRALRARASATQPPLQELLETRRDEGRVAETVPFWVFNGLSVTATADVLAELATRAEVLSITLDEIILMPSSPLGERLASPSGAEPNLTRINAPALWNLGFRGQGIVVANMDTGVDADHPDLSAQWRGGTNSWFDPSGQHPTTPTDTNGHGTWSMGILVGQDNGGTSIGVAPDAQWIAVKIFDDQGKATATRIHQGFQWLLDPDGNPDTPDAPNVVSNSWSIGRPGCVLAFQLDLQALRAAGIVPVFAAGNFGPAGSTSASPANYPEAFAVGATDNSDVVWPESSRGPSACSDPSAVYPQVVAPGVNVRTTDLGGFYYAASGTSMAAPHVAGALALLLSAYPDLTSPEQETAVLSTTVDLGSPGPDNDYGYGRVDVLAAYHRLSESEILFADGFELGNLEAWTASIGGDGISVTAEAAMVGSWGMQAVVSGNSRSFVSDASPTNETSYHARFHFHPNGTDTGNRPHVIFLGRNALGQGIFAVQYRRTEPPALKYQVRSAVRSTAGWVATKWYSISNAPHAIEIGWQSSYSASYSLFVDGDLKKTKKRLDTSAYLLDTVWLGPCARLSSRMSGIEYFDAFLSTRDTYIGP
jgi:subtilisin family serine protease